MLTLDQQKRAAAQAALRFVRADQVLGVGTGSTVDLFIDLLATSGLAVAAAVASSERSGARLRHHGIALVDMNSVEELTVYVDGADEVDPDLALIKGGGAALTREKIVAAAAECFVCIVDAGKCVDRLGRFPLPVEVIPMARAYVIRALRRLGGDPRLRAGVVTDNGNEIIDVHGLTIDDPVALEARIDAIAGVVTNGIFAARRADVLLVGDVDGAREVQRR